MRGTLLICALAAVQAKVPKKGYNECERFITTIYSSSVDDFYDAPNITLAQRPELVKCRLTRTLSTYEIVGMTAVYAATSLNRTDWLAELLARGGDPPGRAPASLCARAAPGRLDERSHRPPRPRPSRGAFVPKSLFQCQNRDWVIGLHCVHSRVRRRGARRPRGAPPAPALALRAARACGLLPRLMLWLAAVRG